MHDPNGGFSRIAESLEPRPYRFIRIPDDPLAETWASSADSLVPPLDFPNLLLICDSEWGLCLNPFSSNTLCLNLAACWADTSRYAW
jgi:hypothetical protein